MRCNLLIIGGEGDLALRKLYPALYRLEQAGCLPEGMRIVGASRHQQETEHFVSQVQGKLAEFLNGNVQAEPAWSTFSQRLDYQAVDATNDEAMSRLRETLFDDPEQDLIIYLAIPPAIFDSVCQCLGNAGMARSNTRIVVEKPLGSDQASFLEINRSLTAIFCEEQVYRIDHYLGKESVQNLLALRFANALFEPLWNNKYIDHVQITVAETVGVEGRWDFYDDAGALRDMVQNHLLQLLCLTAMEPPANLSSSDVSDEKLKVLRSLKPIDLHTTGTHSVRGQYSAGAISGELVQGYTEEEGGKPGSNTETYVALKAEINNWRWARVPFYLRTGKRLANRFSEIVIQFKQVPHSIFGTQQHSPNQLVIRLQPDDGIQLHLMNKVPGLDSRMPLQPVALDLSLSDAFLDTPVPDAYQRLLFDVMQSNSTLFMRADEVEAAWRWTDQIIEGWQHNRDKVNQYTAGSWGPSAAVALLAKDDRDWYEMI